MQDVKEFLNDLSVEDMAILKMILEENIEERIANEGVLIKRQNWTTQNLLDKKINKTVMLIAKAKKDPMYDKFKKFFKLSRFWRKKLRDKYYGLARGIVVSSGGLKAENIGSVVKERFGGEKH